MHEAKYNYFYFRRKAKIKTAHRLLNLLQQHKNDWKPTSLAIAFL